MTCLRGLFFCISILFVLADPAPSYAQNDKQRLLTIQIEEVCLGSRINTSDYGYFSPALYMVPFFGQYFKKKNTLSKGELLLSPINLDEQERLTDLEKASSHYVFKNLAIELPWHETGVKMAGHRPSAPRVDKHSGEESIQYFGVDLSIKKGFTTMIGSRWAFNGQKENQWADSSSPLLELEPRLSEFTKLNSLWPDTAVLVNNSRRFVTIKKPLSTAFTHLAYDARPDCDNTPFIIYSVDLQSVN